MTKTMTEKLADQAILARQVYATLYADTETWKGSIGTDIAYLLGAILTWEKVELSKRSKMAKLLQRSFGPQHEVFKYVTYT